jgi:hypothetical protein
MTSGGTGKLQAKQVILGCAALIGGTIGMNGVARITVFFATACVLGCSNRSPDSVSRTTDQAATAEMQTQPPEGDFRGFAWGDTMEEVSALESKRTHTVRDGYRYSTDLAGLPVILDYGYEGERLAAAKYSFPWPGEAKKCHRLMAAGTECSLESAAYAIDVCGRISVLVGEKYKAVDESDGYAVRPLPSVKELDRRLAVSDSGIDHSTRQWTSERVIASQFLTRGRSNGEGWRCMFQYRPTPEIAERLHAQAEAATRESAKKDL